MTILIDSNVLLDIFTENSDWYEWSSMTLASAADRARLVVNPVIFAEVSVRFSAIEDMETHLPADRFTREPIPFEAAFLAGKAFVQYRRRSGDRA